MILAYAVLVGLASFRLWRITGADTFTETFRDWLYTEPDRPHRDWPRRERVKGFFADLLSCVWCWGWWIAGILAALVAWREGYSLIDFALLWCAGSTIAGLTRKAVDA